MQKSKALLYACLRTNRRDYSFAADRTHMIMLPAESPSGQRRIAAADQAKHGSSGWINPR